MPIKLIDGANMHHAFAEPGNNQEISCRLDTEPPKYHAILAKIHSWDAADNIEFSGVYLETGKPSAYKNRVNLNHTPDAWRMNPAAVDGWDEKTKTHALLFLSETYLDSTPDLRYTTMGDPNKWPRSAGLAEEQVAKLTQKVEELRQALATQEAYVKDVFATLALEHQDKAREIFGDVF